MIKLENVSKVFQLDTETSITPVCEVSLEIAARRVLDDRRPLGFG